ncbi:MAG: hypothetical protein ACPLRN_03555 [Microgenomates group bacterium]
MAMKEKEELSSTRIVECWETERLPSMHKTSPEFRKSLSFAYNEGVLPLKRKF